MSDFSQIDKNFLVKTKIDKENISSICISEKHDNKLANNIMRSVQEEFDTILKQMDLIGNIKGIEEIEPMVYPFPLSNVNLREDEVEDSVPIEELLQNCDETEASEVKVPKVVE